MSGLQRIIVQVPAIGLASVALAFVASPARAEDDAWNRQIAADIRELTGAHTRIVWLQDAGEDPSPWGGGPAMRIMGFDTDDGKGIRPIFREPSDYSWPYLTPDGEGIAFNKVKMGPPIERHVMYANWDGTGVREVTTKAWLAAVGADPKTGSTWLYCLAEAPGDKLVAKRFRLDDPSVSEIVWDKSAGPGRMTVSPDGKMAAGVYAGTGGSPCGVYDLPNIAYHNVGIGCEPAMLPCANPYRMFLFSGDHRSGAIFTNPENPDKITRQPISFENAPATRGRYQVQYPQWSNNVRFMVLAAPFAYVKNDEGIPFPDEGMQGKYKRYYDNVEISIGRLDKNLTRIEKWIQVTNNKRGDYLPEAWIRPGSRNKPVN